MLPVLPVRPCHIVAARSHELPHERIECRHLRSRVRQSSDTMAAIAVPRALEIAPHRFEQQVAVLRYPGRHQFPCSFDLIEILHRPCALESIPASYSLRYVPGRGRPSRRLGGDYLLLCLPALVVQALQFQRLPSPRLSEPGLSVGRMLDGIFPASQDKCPVAIFSLISFIYVPCYVTFETTFLRSPDSGRVPPAWDENRSHRLVQEAVVPVLERLGGNHCPRQQRMGKCVASCETTPLPD